MRTEQTAIQDMTDRLVEFEKCYGMGKNVEKNKVLRISRQASEVQVIDKKQLDKVEHFDCLCNMITNNARFTGKRRIKRGNVMAKSVIQ
jgi:hypothetical protein